MTNDEEEKAVLRGMARVALYHRLPKNEWMAKVVPGVEERLDPPLSEEVIDRIHQAFKEEMPPEMAIDEVTINDCPLLIEQLAEGMAIQAGAMDDTKYLPAAKEFLKQFRAAHRRDPVDYLELETFALQRQQGEHLKEVR